MCCTPYFNAKEIILLLKSLIIKRLKVDNNKVISIGSSYGKLPHL